MTITTTTKQDKKYLAWKTALSLVERSEQEKWIRRTLLPKHNLTIFGRYFFPHIIKGSTPDCHKDLIQAISTRKDCAVIFPRGHAKTTWEKIDTLHDVVNALEPVVLYVGNTLTDAQFHFEGIKIELENNETLRQVYGDVVPPESNLSRKWTNRHLETTNGVNLVARGSGKGRGVNIKNQRPTKIILDDIEDDDLVRSPERRMKLREWLNRVILPSVDKDRGFVKMIGTVLHEDCEVLHFYQDHGGIFRKAIENERSIWWPMDKLQSLKAKIGSIAFAQEYLNEPTNDETAKVKMGWIKFYERGAEPANLTKYAFADLAISTSTSADYFVIIVVGVDQQGGIWVLDLFREKGLTFAGQVEAVIQSHLRHKVVRFGIESVAYQRALEQEVRRQGNAMKPPVYVPAVPVVPDADKERRLLRITPLIENGTVHFLREHTALIEELTRFPNAAHDDTVDTLTGVVTLIGEKRRSNIYILGEDDF